MKTDILLGLFLICYLAVKCNGATLAGTKKLMNKLFKDYSKDVRPINDQNEAVKVQFGLSLLEVINLDENTGRMQMSAWLTMRWVDDQLKWNKVREEGIGEIQVPASSLWLPDIVFYNGIETKMNKELNAVVKSNGVVEWVPPTTFTVTCKHEFRGNAWACPMRFGSWTYNDKEVQLFPIGGDLEADVSEYIGKDQFVVAENKAVVETNRFKCCKDEYPSMMYYIKFRNNMGSAFLG